MKHMLLRIFFLNTDGWIIKFFDFFDVVNADFRCCICEFFYVANSDFECCLDRPMEDIPIRRPGASKPVLKNEERV